MNKSGSFIELATKRQSDRGYLEKEIEKEKLELCLEAARISPSASNSQPWTFIVVDDKELKDKVAKATFNSLVAFNKFTVSAPVIIVMVIEKPKLVTQVGASIKKREYPLIDIGIAAEHLCLQAAELGIGSCMLGWFDENKIKTLLNIPKNKRLGLAITLGYPRSERLRDKIRKPFNEVVKYNSY